MNLKELIKRMFISYFIIFGGAVLSGYLFMQIFGLTAIRIEDINALLIITVLAGLTQLTLYSKKNLDHRQILLRYVIIFPLVGIIVLSVAAYMEWIKQDDYYHFLVIIVLIGLIAMVFSVMLIVAIKHIKLEIAAFTDPLTQAYNRRYFMQTATCVLNTCIKEKRNFSLITLDLDHFKVINDTYGHSVGDEVLITTVSRIIHTLPAGTLVARIGGEEFVVMITDVTKENMVDIARRIKKSLTASQFKIGNLNIAVTASFGIASKKSDNTNLAEIMAKSDEALYKAKMAGRNTIIYYD